MQLALGTPPPVTPPGGGFSALYSVHLSQTDMYDVPNRLIVNHRVSGGGYLRTGPLRAPMDPSVFFAQEGMMDELAHAAGLDPYEFRKRNISHPRWLGVLKAATDAAKWTPRVAASNLSSARVVRGRGIGVGTHHLPQNQGDRVTFAAAVVDIEVNKDNGIVVARHVYGAMDCGLAINPGIVESQIVGMSVHGASLALKEEVQFNRTNVTSLDWNSYLTLRFGDHPTVTPIVVQQLHEKSSGAGEEVLPAVVAAIGNAFFDATGVRIREYPITPRRVLAALKSATNNQDVRLNSRLRIPTPKGRSASDGGLIGSWKLEVGVERFCGDHGCSSIASTRTTGWVHMSACGASADRTCQEWLRPTRPDSFPHFSGEGSPSEIDPRWRLPLDDAIQGVQDGEMELLRSGCLRHGERPGGDVALRTSVSQNRGRSGYARRIALPSTVSLIAWSQRLPTIGCAAKNSPTKRDRLNLKLARLCLRVDEHVAPPASGSVSCPHSVRARRLERSPRP